MQGKFWEMHETLFQNAKRLADVDLTHLALGLGLEVYRFASDLESKKVVDRVYGDYTGGVRSGVQGTPTFFINGRRYRGRIETELLLAAISAA